MKFIKLEILCSKEDSSENDSYKNVLAELNIKDDEDDSSFKEFYINIKTLEDECLYIYSKPSNENETIIEFFDSRSCVVNMKKEDLIELLNDTSNV